MSSRTRALSAAILAVVLVSAPCLAAPSDTAGARAARGHRPEIRLAAGLGQVFVGLTAGVATSIDAYNRRNFRAADAWQVTAAAVLVASGVITITF